MADLRPGDLPPDLPQSLRDALNEYREAHGTVPPRRRWPILFGPDRDPVPENRWMLR